MRRVGLWASWLRRERGCAWLGTALVAAALVLLLLQSMLHVREGWGIEDFLGWVDTVSQRSLHGIWARSQRELFVWLYLGFDSVIFVPLYVAFGLTVARGLVRGLWGSLRREPRWFEVWAPFVLAAPVLSLALVDLLENALGLLRVDQALLAGGVTLLAASALSQLHAVRVALGLSPAHAQHQWRRMLLVVAAVTTLALAFGTSLSGTCRASGPGPWGWRLGCGAHAAKGVLTIGSAALIGAALIVWLFGLDLRPAVSVAELRRGATGATNTRAVLRSAILDTFGRSRYTLIGLAVVGVLTLGMNQGRDLIYAMAAAPFQEALTPSERWKVAAGSLFSLLALGAATAALEFTCWLWTRSVCQLRRASEYRASPQSRVEGEPADGKSQLETPQPLANAYAKYWARALGFVPVLLLVRLSARVVRDGAMLQGGLQPDEASAPHSLAPVVVVLIWGLSMLALGLWLLKRHIHAQEDDPNQYYSSVRWSDWRERIGFSAPASASSRQRPVETAGNKPKYRALFGWVPVYWLPMLLAVGMLACRLVDVWPPSGAERPLDLVPSLSLAVALFSLALWLCFFGWLAILEVHQSIPWVGLLVVGVGMFGSAGLTDNHVVWSAIEPGSNAGGSSAMLRMLGFTALLTFAVLGLYAGAMHIVARHARGASPRRSLALAGGGLVAVSVVGFLVLGWADRAATSRPLGQPSILQEAARPTLYAALARWLQGLCNAGADRACRPLPLAPHAASVPGDRELPVYFVSTEGGGIRAAAWTAFVLDRLAAREPLFLERTFSISGVSGGAVGASALRACTGTDRRQCLDRFASTDMLAPLVSAWFFEDVLARVLPTKNCRTPGCGILSRGAWFEQALEAGAPNFRQALVEQGHRLREGDQHFPYLLLNATWVESGERAIASDLTIESARFPGSKDQLGIIGRDLPLGTAAHNAARFPFINAIGSLHATPAACAALTPGATPTGNEPAVDAQEPFEQCGHLADGGYFDNSGAQSTLDVIVALDACLADPSLAESIPTECARIDAAQRAWLRERLVPQVLMIRNQVDITYACAKTCPVATGRPTPRDILTNQQVATECPNPIDDGYHPERPACREEHELFVGLLGPALTLFNVSGIGANRRLPEARQLAAVRALRTRLGRVGSTSSLPAVRTLDLLPDGTLYPLGWHLSATVVERLWVRAEEVATRVATSPQ